MVGTTPVALEEGATVRLVKLCQTAATLEVAAPEGCTVTGPSPGGNVACIRRTGRVS